MISVSVVSVIDPPQSDSITHNVINYQHELPEGLLAAVNGEHRSGGIAIRAAGQVQRDTRDLAGLRSALRCEAAGPFGDTVLIPQRGIDCL
jgi:hypothetical protein